MSKNRPRKQQRPKRSLEQEQARQRGFDTLRRMRRGESLTRAARKARTTPETVRKYAAPALNKLPSGRYQVTPADRLKRTMRVLTPEGIISVDVGGSRAASNVARHRAAVDRYLQTGMHHSPKR